MLGMLCLLCRPDWRTVFQSVCDEHPMGTVGVFCCGPLALTQDLKVLSRYKTFREAMMCHSFVVQSLLMSLLVAVCWYLHPHIVKFV